MAAPVGFDGRAGHFRSPRRSFSMAAPVGFDGRAGHFRWPIYTTVSMTAPVIFDGRAGRFRWPRRSFSMAAPVGFDGRAGRQLCPYEAQYISLFNMHHEIRILDLTSVVL